MFLLQPCRMHRVPPAIIMKWCRRPFRSTVYSRFGRPADVVRIIEDVLPDVTTLNTRQVLVKFLASPINPSDINQIEGTYPLKPTLPACPGNEGVACVQYTAADVGLEVGDWVIPASPGLGTWRTHAVFDRDDLFRIPSDIAMESAAMLAVNPVTAYRLLHDFIKLSPGAVIIQNAANSAVGVSIIQIAKTLHVKTINVIRDRADFDCLRRHLLELGADFVVREHDLDSLRELPKPILAFNAVGGPSCTNLARTLVQGGQLITYGGMSKKPVTVPTGLLIFNRIALRGFWLTNVHETATRHERLYILQKLMDLVRAGHLKLDFEPVPFDDFDKALERALQTKRKGKVLLTFGK